MKRILFRVCFLFLLLVNTATGYSGLIEEPYASVSSTSDSLRQNPALYNGRIWQNLWYMIGGDQFLFTKEFIPGSITMRGKTYGNIRLKYDIFRDELLIPIPSGGILQVNKELVDSFSCVFQDQNYRFVKSSLKGSEETGYLNILYAGKISLFIKYFKKTEPSKGTIESDRFYQGTRILIFKDGIVSQIRGKKDLFEILKDKGDQLKSYIKKNRLSVSGQSPESFVPVIRYYESIYN